MSQKDPIRTPKKFIKQATNITGKKSSKKAASKKNVRAPVTSDPEIVDAESLKLWLNDKPDEWAEDIAIGAALRVLPLVCRLSSHLKEENLEEAFRYILGAVRTAFYIFNIRERHDGFYAGTVDELMILAKQLAKFDQQGANAYVTLFRAVNRNHDPKIRAINTALQAQKTLAETPNFGKQLIWNSINADANWLLKRPDTPLSTQRLWLFPVNTNDQFDHNAPTTILQPFLDLAAPIISVEDHEEEYEWFPSRDRFWNFWLDWYLYILDRDSSVAQNPLDDDQIEKLLKLPESFWDGDLEQISKTVLEIAKVDIRPRRRRVNRLRTNAQAHTDMPTTEDQLGRRPFARALVARMNDVWTKNEHAGGFAMHLHAPWGAGKTSVLLLMQDEMNRPAVGDPSWVCVDFNAWKHQRRKLPWWPMLEALKKGQLKTLQNKKTGNKLLAMEIRVKWILWKLASDGLPFFIAFIIFALLFVTPFSNKRVMDNISVLDILRAIGAAVTVFGGFLIAGRSLLFGSKSNAVFYFDLSKDPLKRISQLFTALVKTTDRPICIFIDDLDRCAPDYVADLLEGIQTSFRHKNIFYVVAADRAWIRSSFEKRYQSFAQDVGNEGQPIGYLFLEKLFQLSSPLPGIGVDKREQFWRYLLDPERKPEPQHNPEKPLPEISVQEIQENLIILKERDEVLTHEAAKQFDQEHASPAMTAAMIEYVNTSLKDEANRTHILYEFASLLPENPRIMKRVINAFAFRHAITLMEKTYIPLNKIARWTILEQQFPAVADVLAENPNCVENIAKNVDLSQIESVPDYLRPFNSLGTVRQILQSKLNGETDELNSALTPSDVALFTGVNREISVSAT